MSDMAEIIDHITSHEFHIRVGMTPNYTTAMKAVTHDLLVRQLAMKISDSAEVFLDLLWEGYTLSKYPCNQLIHSNDTAVFAILYALHKSREGQPPGIKDRHIKALHDFVDQQDNFFFAHKFIQRNQIITVKRSEMLDMIGKWDGTTTSFDEIYRLYLIWSRLHNEEPIEKSYASGVKPLKRHVSADRYMYQSWYVKLWRSRFLLLLPIRFFRGLKSRFKIREAWAFALGFYDMDRNNVLDSYDLSK